MVAIWIVQFLFDAVQLFLDGINTGMRNARYEFLLQDIAMMHQIIEHKDTEPHVAIIFFHHLL